MELSTFPCPDVSRRLNRKRYHRRSNSGRLIKRELLDEASTLLRVAASAVSRNGEGERNVTNKQTYTYHRCTLFRVTRIQSTIASIARFTDRTTTRRVSRSNYSFHLVRTTACSNAKERLVSRNCVVYRYSRFDRSIIARSILNVERQHICTTLRNVSWERNCANDATERGCNCIPVNVR